MNAADFVANLYRDLRQAVDAVRADRAVAQGTQNAGLITIQRLTETSPDLEALARVKGFATADQDEVVTLQMKGGKEFVLGTLQRTAPTGYSLDAPLDAPIPNLVFTMDYAATGVTNATNASTGTPIEAAHVNFTLPSGTWSVRVAVSVLATHSANGQAYCQPALDGSAISSCGATVTSGTPSRVANSGEYTGIASGSHTAAVNFRPNTAGTMTVSNPQILIDAWRTA